jgi:HEAT repeat protein
VAAVPASGSELPPEAARLLPLVPGEAALDLLAMEADPGRRAVLVRIAEARLPADADAVVSRLAGLEPDAARGLFHALVARAPHRATAAAAALLEHRDERLQLAALQALAASEGEVPLEQLMRLLQSPREPVRIAAAGVLARRPVAAAFRAVAEALQGRKEYSTDEAAALGRALARLGPPQASALFLEWLAPRKGLLGRLTGASKQEQLLRWAAVAGLGAHPTPEAAAQIEVVAKDADEALRRHCFATLARRRHEGTHHG